MGQKQRFGVLIKEAAAALRHALQPFDQAAPVGPKAWIRAVEFSGMYSCGCGDATGWVQALREPKLGRAIVALHRDPGRNWSVAELATEAGVSR